MASILLDYEPCSRISQLYIGEPIWAFLFGVIIGESQLPPLTRIPFIFFTLSGPYGAGIFDPRSWGNHNTETYITLELTRVVLAIGVFAVGVELPKAYMRKHWKSLLFLLAPVMTYVCPFPSSCSVSTLTVLLLGVVCFRRVNLCPYPKTQLPLIPCRRRMSHPD